MNTVEMMLVHVCTTDQILTVLAFSLYLPSAAILPP